MVRVIASAFEMSHLPNRVELRLKSTGRVIGYTLAHIRDAAGEVTGAALFFKDLTRVEQLEERERLRDRLAALGEMAAAVAHEIKNPLAGIEVMAGLLRRQLRDNAQATALVGDIINEAKMANAIVQEILDFVRPVRLQMERTSVGAALQAAVTMADGKAKRGQVAVTLDIAEGLPLIDADRTQLMQVFANLLINAFEALTAPGRSPSWPAKSRWKTKARCRRTACIRCPRSSSMSPTAARACRPSWPTRSSAPSSPRRLKAPGSGWPSYARSSTPTTGGST
jgi:signal transduction histidine kinase